MIDISGKRASIAGLPPGMADEPRKLPMASRTADRRHRRGRGFAGLAAVKALGRTRPGLADRSAQSPRIQPLLYQAATAMLHPSDIAAPIRDVCAARQHHRRPARGDRPRPRRRKIVSVAPDRGEAALPYDYLVLATGVEESYFGHDACPVRSGAEVARRRPGDRSKLLRAYETAETEEDPLKHRDLLTIVLVGAGPTGVELAGAISAMARVTLKPNSAASTPHDADRPARQRPPHPGRLLREAVAQGRRPADLDGRRDPHGANVDRVDEEGVVVAGQRIVSRTVLWTAASGPRQRDSG